MQKHTYFWQGGFDAEQKTLPTCVGKVFCFLDKKV